MPEPSARLYLIAPPPPRLIADSCLSDALSAGDIACVLLPSLDTVGSDAADLIRLVQSRGAAALFTGDAAIIAGTDADGIHVTGGDVSQAVRRMKPSRIVGVGALASRDDAMTAGEQEVDYLMFGDAVPGDAPPAFDERLDQVSWWAEIFRVPCVAMAYAFEEITAFVEAGAEFIGLGELVWDDSRGAAAAICDAMDALRQGHSTFLARQNASA